MPGRARCPTMARSPRSGDDVVVLQGEWLSVTARPSRPQQMEDQMKRSIYLLPGILAATLAVTPAEAVTLGASVQLSGPLANFCFKQKAAYEMAIDVINKAGGVKVGGKAEKLELKILDNQ